MSGTSGTTGSAGAAGSTGATPAAADAAKPVMSVDSIGMTFRSGQGQDVHTLADVSLALGEREILALVGPSGCGKTTLFNIIAGLLEPTRGSVHVQGTRVRGAAGQVGYMLQKDMLLPWRTVIENVVLGLEVRGADAASSRATAMRLIEAYGLKGFENNRPATLSGGMRQRVAFMRTLAFDPDVILLDEPFSALDFQTRILLQGEVLRIIRERGKSAILVTHDIGEAITMADRILVLTHRPATVRAVHDIALTLEERDPVALRKNPAYHAYFDLIWSELDVQM
jgi:NitT/TauT family transport system ATP-binding protein